MIISLIVMPAKAGIQYAAAVARTNVCSGILDHPPLRVMTAEWWHSPHHGSAKRSVLPPLLMSTAANPVATKPRLVQSPCSLVSNLVSRVQSCVPPPQFSGLSLYLTARLSASTASAKLKICLGWPTTSGCRHLPGSIRYQPRLITVLPSSVPTGALSFWGGVLQL